MAKATKRPSDYTLILELSRDEAETLRGLCRCITGSPITSRRKHTDAMEIALEDAGVRAIRLNRGDSGLILNDGDV